MMVVYFDGAILISDCCQIIFRRADLPSDKVLWSLLRHGKPWRPLKETRYDHINMYGD
jgi:hypothetical protein